MNWRISNTERVGASLFLASVPGKSIDWQVNGLLPAQMGLAGLAGLAAAALHRLRPRGRAGKTGLLCFKPQSRS